MRHDLEVTAVVISYNSEERIAEAIEAHERALAHIPAEILIVDNASTDRTIEVADSHLTMGRVVANSDNLGYGKAANLAFQQARGRRTIILNDDARLSRDAVDRLLEVMNNDPRIALAGPRIVDEDGEQMPSARLRYPGLAEEGGLIVDALNRVNTNYTYPVGGTDPQDVAWLVGACIMGDTQILLDTGGFNPAFFLYAEDIDLCRRMTELGHRVVTVPDAVCVHTGSVSTGAAFTSDARMTRRSDAREIFYRIWYGRPTRALIHARRAIGLKHQPWRVKYHVPKILRDGGSLADGRFPPPLEQVSADGD